MISNAEYSQKRRTAPPQPGFWERLSRRGKWFLGITAAYALFLHLGLGVVLAKSNFIDEVKRKAGFKPASQEFDSVFRQSQHWWVRLDEITEPNSILLLGDSQLLGLNLKNLPKDVMNFGVSGDTTERLVRRLPSINSVNTASAVFLSVGINDLVFRDVEETIEKYREVLEFIPVDMPLAMSTVFPIDESLEDRTTNDVIRRLNDAIRALCNNRDACQLVDVTKSMTDAQGQLNAEYHTGDGLHLSKAGYAIWREAIRPVMEGLVAEL